MITYLFIDMVWIVASMAMLSKINLDLWYLIGIIRAESGSLQALLAFIQLVRLFVYSSLLLTVFVRPGSRGIIIPPRDIRRDLNALLEMILLGIFAISFHGLLGQLQLLTLFIAGYTATMDFSEASTVFLIGVILSSPYAILRTYRGIRNKTKPGDVFRLPTSSDTKRVAQTLKRIEEKLDDHEQRELAQLLYQSATSKKVNIQRILRIVFYTVIIAFVIEVLEGIVAVL